MKAHSLSKTWDWCPGHPTLEFIRPRAFGLAERGPHEFVSLKYPKEKSHSQVREKEPSPNRDRDRARTGMDWSRGIVGERWSQRVLWFCAIGTAVSLYMVAVERQAQNRQRAMAQGLKALDANTSSRADTV